MHRLACVLLLLLNGHISNGLPDEIKIGFLHTGDDGYEAAFKYAVEEINSDTSILPRSKLSAQIERISPQDSFQASKKVCQMLQSGVAGIFGPQSPQTSDHVQSICQTMEIPHVDMRCDFNMRQGDSLINLYPHPRVISMAYVDLVKAMGWKSFTIIYETNEGLLRLQELIKEHEGFGFEINVAQLGEESDYKPLLKKIKNSGASHIVLDCSTDKIFEVLKQAQQIGMMSDYHSYLITSLDLHTVDLEAFKYGGTNITAFRLIHFDRALTTQSTEFPLERTETALMLDALLVFATALQKLDASQRIDIQPLDCDSNETWSHGHRLITEMKKTQIFDGMTGVVNFDNQGFRSSFSMIVIELGKYGLEYIGKWNTVTRSVNFTRTFEETYTQIAESLLNKTLAVSVVMSPPFVMRKDSNHQLYGNDLFEGYSIDLLQEISKILGFKYTVEQVADGRYGSLNKVTKKWDGMVGELLERRADLAVADLTITSEREQAIDFSMPFMHAGISILYRRPMKQEPSIFTFLSPFSCRVWMYIAVAYIAVSTLIFFLARFTPFEKEEQNSNSDKAEDSKNQFSVANSFWFTIGSLMQQGSNIVPKAFSTRMIAAMWWFFALIMISSYIANLTAFLTIERMDSPIESVEDLAMQSRIKFGAVRDGSTAAFFRNSDFSTYQHIWAAMESAKPSVFASTNFEGMSRVLRGKGNYAFFMESTALEYNVERNCELIQVGGLLDSKAFGIAMPSNSPYRSAINRAILKLQEQGKLQTLKTKWWRERGGESCKNSSPKSNVAYELGLPEVGGVFVLLIAGMGLACLIAVAEVMLKSRKAAREYKLRNVQMLSD